MTTKGDETKTSAAAVLTGETLVATPSRPMEYAVYRKTPESAAKSMSERIETIWKPLFSETLKSPKSLLLGNGRYAIVSSQASKRGDVLAVFEPHNMYLEQILDIGLIGFVLFLFAFISIVKEFFKIKPNDLPKELYELKYPLMISVASFLLSGMTGQHLFPVLSNCYFWVVLGVVIGMIRFKMETISVNSKAVRHEEN